MNNRIMVIMAHADDAEIWSGGSLLNHYKQGDEIFFLYLFCNDEVRREEAKKVAKFFETSSEFISPDNKEKIINLINSFKPNIIITHWEGDTHHEHVSVFSTVFQVTPSLIIDYGNKFNIFCCDSYNSLGRQRNSYFIPTDYIDISSVWEEKKGLISHYESQPVGYWLKMIQNQNAIYGSRVGVEYAEGFMQIPVLGVIRKSTQYLKGV